MSSRVPGMFLTQVPWASGGTFPHRLLRPPVFSPTYTALWLSLSVPHVAHLAWSLQSSCLCHHSSYLPEPCPWSPPSFTVALAIV